MKGIVIKKLADLFTVLSGENAINMNARGNLKRDNNKILVGDEVEFQKENGEYVITSVGPRKNELVRPPISNLDNLVIVITREPKPDLMLVDKLIIICQEKGINPIIVISKADILDEEFVQDLVDQYSPVIKNILVLSSFSGQGKNELLILLNNKTSSLVGQSAVGKSSIINMLGGKTKVGEVSQKTKRGKNTTRHSEINVFENGVRLADTSGFSRLFLENADYRQLMRKFVEFLPYARECKYSTCVHIPENECDCAVKRAVKAGKINNFRYTRYMAMYEEMKKQWERRFD